MQPNKLLISITNNELLIKKLLYELILEPRLKALEWSKITKQTPNLKVGYPAQHLASLVLGMEGTKTGARGNDIVDGSEVKSCNRVDQLDTCANCGEKVLRIETICPNCNSNKVKRMDDSKWLFTIRSENDLNVLLEDVKRVVLTVADYPYFSENNFDELRFQVFEIWTQSPRNKHFKTLMSNYYHKIYLTHKTRNPNKTPAPKNFWPFSYQFYMCNPIKIFSCIVKNANRNPHIEIEKYIYPNVDRSPLPSEDMPSYLLNQEEWRIILQKIPNDLLIKYLNSKNLDKLLNEQQQIKPNLKNMATLLPYISEEIRHYLPLRDTDKITEIKLPYQRK